MSEGGLAIKIVSKSPDMYRAPVVHWAVILAGKQSSLPLPFQDLRPHPAQPPESSNVLLKGMSNYLEEELLLNDLLRVRLSKSTFMNFLILSS